MTTANRQPARDRPTFTLVLRAEPNIDAIRALRALLKVALRRFGLRVIAAHEDNGRNNDARPNTI
jgi:hypothetical protein